jgi:RNA polymerase sigma-54 factor
MIRDIIAREEPDAPISDSKIAETLKARGLDVARRTVAKYREELGIQSSHLRKAY